MEFNFKIKEDRLIAGKILSGNSGNVKTYICNFDIADYEDFTWICVFKQGEEAYQQVIENGKCVIPQVVLETSGTFEIGCYGTDMGRRVSTNWLEFGVEAGAYCKATLPQEPEPDVWESLIMNALPYIGENGNWYVYDKECKAYIDSGKASRGEKGEKGDAGDAGLNGRDGYTPQRGVDYWTKEDREAVKAELEDDLNFEERLASTVGNYGNALEQVAEGGVVVMSDVSPIEHKMTVKLRSKNLIPYPYYDTSKTQDGITWTDNGDGTITANGTATANTRFSLRNSVNPFKLEPGKTYITCAQPEEIDREARARVIVQSTDYKQNIENAVPIKATKTDYYAFISIQSGTVCDNVVFKPQLEEGTTATPYTKYIEDLTTVTVKRCGKNLIPYPYFDTTKTQDGIEWTDNGDGTVTANGTATADTRFSLQNSISPFRLESGKTYVTCAQPEEIDQSVRGRVVVQSTDYKQNIENAVPVMATKTDYYAFISIQSGTVCNNVVFKPQLEEASVATNYEAYKCKEYEVLSDGSVEGVTAICPVTTLKTDTQGIIIDCEYNRDINKAYKELINAIISLGGNI